MLPCAVVLQAFISEGNVGSTVLGRVSSQEHLGAAGSGVGKSVQLSSLWVRASVLTQWAVGGCCASEGTVFR